MAFWALLIYWKAAKFKEVSVMVVVVCIRALCYPVVVSSFYLLVESALHPIFCFSPCLLVL